MVAIKEKVIEFIKKNNINPTSFCKNSSIAPAAIQNMIKANSPNPTIETVIQIAKIMNCSVDELLSETNSENEIKEEINFDLLKSVCVAICTADSIKGKTMIEFNQAVTQIYKYCSNNSLKAADKTFTNWYIKNKHNINI